MSSPPRHSSPSESPAAPRAGLSLEGYKAPCVSIVDAGYRVELGFEFLREPASGHHVFLAFGIALHGLEILFRPPLRIVGDVSAAEAAVNIRRDETRLTLHHLVRRLVQ